MRIVFVSNYSNFGLINPDWLFTESGKMMGGGESSFIYMSRELARRGHDVTVVTPTDKDAVYDGVRWLPVPSRMIGEDAPPETEEYLSDLGDIDVLVGLDFPSLFKTRRKAKLVVNDNQCHHAVLEANDRNVDCYFARSQWHVDTLLPFLDGHGANKFFVVPNGVDPVRYAEKRAEKNPYRMIWSSSPDRGLHHIMRMWPAIRKRVPGAELHIYYEVMKLARWHRTNPNEVGKRLREVVYGFGYPGVFGHGAVDQHTLAIAQSESSVLAYPMDTEFPTEGFCITVLENMAAGNTCILSDCDCLPEVYGDTAMILRRPINHDEWTNAIVGTMNGTLDVAPFIKAGRLLASKMTWAFAASIWEAAVLKALEQRD